MLRFTARLALALGLLAGSAGPASAFTITVDGVASEWHARTANVANVGIVVRDAVGHGEYAWRDALNDHRLDLGMRPDLDITEVHVTGTAVGLAVFIRTAQPPGANSQFQVALDLDRVEASGQNWFAGFADTRTAEAARWEYLLQASFGNGARLDVWDRNFYSQSAGNTAEGSDGAELFVPWAALGLDRPPAAPIRITVASFASQPNGLTVDLGGSGISNAIDVASDYANPASAGYPSTWIDVQDGVVDDSFDAWFDAGGEVYAPVLITRIASNAGAAGEWIAVRNVSATALALDDYKLGDEETPDQPEGMFSFPAGTTVGPGATVIVAARAADYHAAFGELPLAEFTPSLGGVPDMVRFTAWGPGTFDLADAGDEVLLLDASSTVLDVAAYGEGAYPGMGSFLPPPAAGRVLARRAGDLDTDDVADFLDRPVCAGTGTCGACAECSLHACMPRELGTGCVDGNICNGDEMCDGDGNCVAGPPGDGLGCDDGDACTAEDMCLGGRCVGTLLEPFEVGYLQVARQALAAVLTWPLADGATSSTVLRGRIEGLPVGPDGAGTDETCTGPLAETTWRDAEMPLAGRGFWYLVRGENACGHGTWGSADDGQGNATVRWTPACE